LRKDSPEDAVPRVVRVLVLSAAVLIPIRVLGHGYLPVDDALRHAGKVVSGKEWSEILVLRPDMPIDSHPGWHAALGLVHRVTGLGTHGLVVFSVVALFALVSLPAVVLMRRPEAWALSLLALAVAEPRLWGRLLLGRPFLVTLAAYLTILFLLPRLQSPSRPPWLTMGSVAAFLALAIWMHPIWYLSMIPVLGCVLARWWRAAARLLACLVVAVLVAGCLTGHPIDFVLQSLQHGRLTVALDAQTETLSMELRPQSGSPDLLLALLVLLGWRALQGRLSRADLDTPVFWLVALGWALGWISLRFWSEWGMPALLVFMALQLQELIAERLPEKGLARLAVAGAACAVCVLSLSANVDGRWQPTHRRYLALFNPAARDLLPDAGGILYSDDMTMFFQGIYRLPQAPWRYMVGFEPALMPPQDLSLYRAMTDRRNRVPEMYEVWVRRMRPEDRMILETTGLRDPPPVGGLEWRFIPPAYWSGRVPRRSPPPGPQG
jgi:hypothetical protein